jgi:hypothetical protein
MIVILSYCKYIAGNWLYLYLCPSNTVIGIVTIIAAAAAAAAAADVVVGIAVIVAVVDPWQPLPLGGLGLSLQSIKANLLSHASPNDAYNDAIILLFLVVCGV